MLQSIRAAAGARRATFFSETVSPAIERGHIPSFATAQEANNSDFVRLINTLPIQYQERIQGDAYSMPHVLKSFGLKEIYESEIDEDKVLYGMHGTAESAAIFMTPQIQDTDSFANQQNYKSSPRGDNSLYITNNSHASVHYASTNSIILSGLSNPWFYDPGYVIFCFGYPFEPGELEHGQLMTWHNQKRRNIRMGDQLLVPQARLPSVSLLPFFQIKGRPRLFPLKNGDIVNIKNISYTWREGGILEQCEATGIKLKI